MLNTTHTLTGLLLARSGLDRWAPRAALTSIIAANLPDIDIVAGFPGSVGYIAHHRGITHSAIGIIALTTLLAAALYPFTRTFWKTFLVGLLAMATHPLLDYANTYGIQPLLPFSATRYYGDTLHVIDPYLDAILLAGVVGGNLLKRRMHIAWCAAAAGLVYVGFRVELRNSAHHDLAAYVDRVPGVTRIAVFPGMIDPRDFTGMVEAPEEYIRVRLRVGLETAHNGVEVSRRIPKGDWSHPAVSRASATRTGAVFRGFARFPGMYVEQAAEGYRVTLIDYRFYNETDGSAFGGEILLSQRLDPIAESLSFRRKLASPAPYP